MSIRGNSYRYNLKSKFHYQYTQQFIFTRLDESYDLCASQFSSETFNGFSTVVVRALWLLLSLLFPELALLSAFYNEFFSLLEIKLILK